MFWCKTCQQETEQKVKDSRFIKKGNFIYRTRVCKICKARFYTSEIECIPLREMRIIEIAEKKLIALKNKFESLKNKAQKRQSEVSQEK